MNKAGKSVEDAKRLHYWLVAGSVVINVEDNIQAVPANAMIITDDQRVGEHQLGKAQQALQVSFFKRLGETVQVVDVILHNLVHLGAFTDAEFHSKPIGVEVQERQPGMQVTDLTKLMN